MKKYLFLDDLRYPKEAHTYTGKRIFIKKKWDIVRNYNQFVEYIEKNGLPDFISFDHDLADTHYTPEEYWDDYEANKAYQESLVHNEKTGYECAKWLIDYCIDNGYKLPEFYCHSMNPVGRDKINSILNQYQQLCN